MAAHLDHVTVPVYTMTIVAIWSVDPARSSSALLTIYVSCQQILSPVHVHIQPNNSGLSSCLRCSDASGLSGVMLYSHSTNYGMLGINNDTGAIDLSSPDSISYSVSTSPCIYHTEDLHHLTSHHHHLHHFRCS